MDTTIKIKSETKDRLEQIRDEYKFSGYDAVILMLLNNVDRLELILKRG